MTLSMASLGNGGSASVLGASSNAASNLVFNGGKLQYTGSAAISTDRLLTVGGGGFTIKPTGSGSISFTNTGSIAYTGTAGTFLNFQGASGLTRCV